MRNKIFNYSLVFCCLVIIGFVLLFLSSLIPSSYMKDNVKEGSEVLIKDGRFVVYDLKYKKESLYAFADALMLNTAYSIDSRSPIKSFVLARKNYIPSVTKEFRKDTMAYNVSKIFKNNKDISPVEELYELMHTKKINDSIEYARFWHGYLIFLRPLLLFFNYSTIKSLLFVFTSLCIILITYLLYKKIDLITSLIFIFGMFSINILFLTQSISDILIYLITFVSIIFLLLRYEKIKDIGLYFFIVGSLTSFLDFFTAPLISFGLCAIVYFLLLQNSSDNLDIKYYIKKIIMIGLSWVLGYFLIWSVKWIITDLFFDRNIILKSLRQILYRISSPKVNHKSVNSFLTLIYVFNYLSTPFILVIFLSIVFIILELRNCYKNKKILVSIFPYVLLSVIPILWIIFIKQHSIAHPFFVYRIFSISIISLLIISYKIIKIKRSYKIK